MTTPSTMVAPEAAQITGDIMDLLTSWELSLRSARKSPRTLETYSESVRQLAATAHDLFYARRGECSLVPNPKLGDICSPIVILAATLVLIERFHRRRLQHDDAFLRPLALNQD